MVAKQYIISKLTDLIERFSESKIQYGFDEMAVVHTIFILPNSVYFNNEEYLKAEEEIIFDFIDKYPDQNISFITDNSLLGIKTIDHEFIGANYNSSDLTVNYDDIFTNVLSASILPGVTNELLTGFKPVDFKSVGVISATGMSAKVTLDISLFDRPNNYIIIDPVQPRVVSRWRLRNVEPKFKTSPDNKFATAA